MEDKEPSSKHKSVIEAASGYTFKNTGKNTERSRVSIKLARMHRQYGQTTRVPSLSFPIGLNVGASSWLPQGQSYYEKESLEGRNTPINIHLHMWPESPTLRSLNSTFFIMQLDVERVLHAVDEKEMNATTATKFTIFLTESVKPLLLHTPRDYALVATDEPVRMVIKTDSFFPGKGSFNLCTVEIHQHIFRCKTSRLHGYEERKAFHVLILVWCGKEHKLFVVGRGEGWTFLQHLSCSQFAVTFAKKILSKLSYRKQAQLHMLQCQILDYSHPSYQHVKSFMDKDCDFFKNLLALEKFELCDVYHYEVPAYDGASDSSSGGEEYFDYGMDKEYSNLATLPVKVGVGHGVVKIGLPINVNCFSKVADLVIASMTTN